MAGKTYVPRKSAMASLTSSSASAVRFNWTRSHRARVGKLIVSVLKAEGCGAEGGGGGIEYSGRISHNVC